jgi:hypothetical protein
MVTLYIAMQWLSKHVSSTTDTNATMKDIVENDIFNVVRAEVL